MKKIAFFEEINPEFYSLLDKYLKNDFKAYCLNIDEKYKQKPEIKKYLQDGDLTDLSKVIFDYILYRKAVSHAFENVDHLFDKYFSSSRSIKTVEKLLDFQEIKDMYKYRLLTKLKNIYISDLKINKIIKEEKPDEVVFFPSDNFKIHSDESSPLIKSVKILDHNSLIRKLKNSMEKIRLIFLLSAPFYMLFKKLGGISRNKARKNYKVGIKEDYPRHMFLMNYHGNNVFLDEKELPTKDVLFIVPWKKEKINLEKNRKYNCASLYDGRENLSIAFLWNKIAKSFVPAWLKLLFFSLFEEPSTIKTNRSIMFDYIAFNILLDNYEIQNYVKRLLPENSSATSILSEHGVKTWFVFPDNTVNDYHLDWNPNRKNRILCSFMHFDNAVIHGNILERDFGKHRNHFKKYVKTGVLFSQMVRELEEGKLKSPIFDIIKIKKLPKKLIGVFDTTYLDYGPVKIKDGERFASAILKLLDDFPDIGIIFKTAKEPNTIPELTPIYTKLENHDRCLVFYHRASKEGISAPEVIAASDLTISAPYTSVAAEALGARKRAMYYDCTGRHIGNKYYFNNYPNFVAHDYDELKKLVKYWLYEATDKNFDSFLEKYVKDETDPYLDGKAFTRLRKLLMDDG